MMQVTVLGKSKRDMKFKVGDHVWKKNRVLSSTAQGVMAKLAPKYVGNYKILEKKGPNTYKLMDQEGDIRVSHFKITR